jgi:tRNA A37 methylthiotransferase MiaB
LVLHALNKALSMPGKLYVKTHGCQMNEYDSAKMADVLRHLGSGSDRRG